MLLPLTSCARFRPGDLCTVANGTISSVWRRVPRPTPLAPHECMAESIALFGSRDVCLVVAVDQQPNNWTLTNDLVVTSGGQVGLMIDQELVPVGR